MPTRVRLVRPLVPVLLFIAVGGWLSLSLWALDPLRNLGPLHHEILIVGFLIVVSCSVLAAWVVDQITAGQQRIIDRLDVLQDALETGQRLGKVYPLKEPPA